MNSIVLKLITGNVVKRLRISTEDFDYKDLMAAAALSIPNGDLFFLSVDSEHTTKTIANEVEWKECKLEASDDTVPLRIRVTKIETDDTVDAVLITTERQDSQKIKADILKTKNKNKNFTENILNSVSSDVDELTKHARSFMEVTGVADLDLAKRFVQNSKNEVDKAVMEYFSNPNATPPPLHNDEPPTLLEDPEGSKNHFNLKMSSQEARTATLKAKKAKLTTLKAKHAALTSKVCHLRPAACKSTVSKSLQPLPSKTDVNKLVDASNNYDNRRICKSWRNAGVCKCAALADEDKCRFAHRIASHKVKKSDVIAKNIAIGSSGKTMRLVGNYTLAIAMLLIWGPTAFQAIIDINCAIVSIASTFIFKLCFKCILLAMFLHIMLNITNRILKEKGKKKIDVSWTSIFW